MLLLLRPISALSHAALLLSCRWIYRIGSQIARELAEDRLSRCVRKYVRMYCTREEPSEGAEHREHLTGTTVLHTCALYVVGDRETSEVEKQQKFGQPNLTSTPNFVSSIPASHSLLLLFCLLHTSSFARPPVRPSVASIFQFALLG